LDWQTLCPDHPVLDLILLLCTSVTHENLDSWTDDLIRIYMEAFKKTCLQFNILSPFDMKEFQDTILSPEILLFMCWKSMGDTQSKIKNIAECV